MPLLALLLASQAAHAFYDSSKGRWINRDPIGEEGGANLSGIVDNNPVDQTDELGLITVGFYGFDSWIPGKNLGNQLLEKLNKEIPDSAPLFNSASVSAAFRHLLTKLDTNGNGKYDTCDNQQEIKIYGWSWGGASAVLLAERIRDSDKFLIKDVKVVAVVDPSPRFSKPPVPNNVFRFFNRYQTKGPGVPLKIYGVSYRVEQGVSDTQKDLNPTGTATTTRYRADGMPERIDHMSILWEVAAELLQELK